MSAISTNVGPFAMPTHYVLLLICALVAASVGYFAGRRQQTRIGSNLADMALIAALIARVVFVASWFEQYSAAPWSILDIRDGGFTPWAAVLAAILVALWQGWRRAALRVPLLLGLVAGSLVWFVANAGLRLSSGPTLSELEEIPFTSPQGTQASLASLAHGKPMVINLWATWCPPCRREMPVLADAQRRFPDVNFVFVNQGEHDVTVQKYLSSNQLVLSNVMLDSGKKLGQQLGSMALPTTLFYGADGHLVDTHLGALSSASLAAKLERLTTRVTVPGRPIAQ